MTSAARFLRPERCAAGIGALCAVASGTAAAVTVRYVHDVSAAVTYHDLYQATLLWLPRLRLWSRVAWVALVVAELLLAVFCAVRIARQGWSGWLLVAALMVPGLNVVAAPVAVRRAGQTVSGPFAVLWGLLLGGLTVHVVLAWRGGMGRSAPSSGMAFVSGTTVASARAHDAAVSASPLFPAFGWWGLLLVCGIAVVTAWMFASGGVRSGRGVS